MHARATAAEAGVYEEDTDALMAWLTRINEHNAVARPAPADAAVPFAATQDGRAQHQRLAGRALEGFPAGAVASFAAQADGLPVLR